MRPTTTAPAAANKTTGAAKPAAQAPSNVTPARPFAVSNTNRGNGNGMSQGDQIKAALDTLGIKLIKSEAERDVLKKLVEDTRQNQQRLERELLENRKELAESRRKIDDYHKETEGSRNRQERLEERLRDSQAGAVKLSRKLEADEQKRARLQRRMERLESIADEAQQALQSRAMVLLTDRGVAEASGYPMLPASGPALPPPLLGTSRGAAGQPPISLDETSPDMPWWKWHLNLNAAVAAGAVLIALGIGWAVSAVNYSGQQSAVAVLQDGSLAQIDLRTGTLKPLQLSLKTLATETAAVAATEPETPSVSEQGQPLPPAKPEPVAAAADAPAPDETLTGALKELQNKAYTGIPEAQHDLAALYTAGSGVKQDYERAAYWFTQAAGSGVANAAYNLGVLYHQGLGVGKNIRTALDWYRQAALQGHPEAQYNLGIAYIEGIGTKYNPQLAAGFFQQAALSGITEAAYNLGLILENGLLAEPRPNQALMWYRVGAEGGSSEARNALEGLSERLGLKTEKAGFLPDGTSLSKLVQTPEMIEPAAGEGAAATAPALDLRKVLPELAEMIPNRDELVTAQIQEQLTARNYYNGPEDGAMSQKVINAIKAYQKDADVSGDAKADALVLLRMLKENTSGDITRRS